jgi:hypothetical protein
VIVDPKKGDVTAFITGLPTGDHPAEQMAFKDGWITGYSPARPGRALTENL